MDYEEFLTINDIGNKRPSRVDLERLNGHPLGNNEQIEVEVLEKEAALSGFLRVVDEDERAIGTTKFGTPIFRNTDNSDLYKQLKGKNTTEIKSDFSVETIPVWEKKKRKKKSNNKNPKSKGTYIAKGPFID